MHNISWVIAVILALSCAACAHAGFPRLAGRIAPGMTEHQITGVLGPPAARAALNGQVMLIWVRDTRRRPFAHPKTRDLSVLLNPDGRVAAALEYTPSRF